MKKMKMMWGMAALPFVVGFLLFYILPFASSMRFSLIESTFSSQFVGLQNYAAVLTNSYYRLALMNTLRLIALGVPAVVGSALILALIASRLGERYALARAGMILPLLLPSAAVVPAFAKLSAQHIALPVYAMYVWKNAGFLMLLLIAALSSLPREVDEAAALDGAAGVYKILYITLPQLFPALFFTCILGVAYNLRIFKETYLLYGAYPDTSLYLMQHYMNNHFNKMNYQNLTSAAMIFAALVFLFIFCAYKAERRME